MKVEPHLCEPKLPPSPSLHPSFLLSNSVSREPPCVGRFPGTFPQAGRSHDRRLFIEIPSIRLFVGAVGKVKRKEARMICPGLSTGVCSQQILMEPRPMSKHLCGEQRGQGCLLVGYLCSFLGGVIVLHVCVDLHSGAQGDTLEMPDHTVPWTKPGPPVCSVWIQPIGPSLGPLRSYC